MVAKSLGGFEADLRKFSKIVEQRVSTVRRHVSLSLHQKVIERTPVDTGRARLSWNISDAAPDDSVAPPGDHGGAGAGAQAVAKGLSVDFSNPWGKTWVVNALPYIESLEFGSSKQAPNGMVRIALAEVEAGIGRGGR